MDNFILEIPNFLSPQLCEMIVNRFGSDDTRKEGTYIYNLNRNFITSGKNCIDINITDSSNWGDINNIMTDLSHEAVKKYENHLKRILITIKSVICSKDNIITPGWVIQKFI